MVKKCPFFQLFLLGNLGQENVFYHILKRKNAFLGYKNKKLKQSKNWDFSKGAHGFRQKMAIFPSFFFGNIGQENVFYDILERKNAFLGYKTRSWNSRKIEIFPNGLTHGFGPKMAIFQTFSFRKFRPGKCLSRYSWTKKRLSML